MNIWNFGKCEQWEKDDFLMELKEIVHCHYKKKYATIIREMCTDIAVNMYYMKLLGAKGII